MGFIKNLFFKIRNGVFVLFFAFKDKRSPLYAKIISLLAFLYLVLPIDILPDIIFPAGLLDDMAITPALLYFAYKSIPGEVVKDARLSSQKISEFAGKLKIFLIIATILAVLFFAALIYIIIRLIAG